MALHDTSAGGDTARDFRALMGLGSGPAELVPQGRGRERSYARGRSRAGFRHNAGGRGTYRAPLLEDENEGPATTQNAASILGDTNDQRTQTQSATTSPSAQTPRSMDMMPSSSAPTGVHDLLTRLVAIGEHLQQNGYGASGAIFRWKQQIQLDQILQVPACNALWPPKWFSNIERCIKDFNRVAERDMLNIRTQAQIVSRDEKLQVMGAEIERLTQEAEMKDASIKSLRTDNGRLSQDVATRDATVEDVKAKLDAAHKDLNSAKVFLCTDLQATIATRKLIVKAIQAKSDHVRGATVASVGAQEYAECLRIDDALTDLHKWYQGLWRAVPTIDTTVGMPVLLDYVRAYRAVVKLLEGWEQRIQPREEMAVSQESNSRE